MFLAPDNGPFYRSARIRPFDFWASGSTAFLGPLGRGIGFDLDFDGTTRKRTITDYDPNRTVELTHDGFLSQRLIYNLGIPITRRQIIKYIANKASGVHSGVAQDDVDKALARIRRCVTYKRVKGREFSLDITADGWIPDAPDPPFKHDPNAFDAVVMELVIATHLLVISPRVLELESVVATELGSGSPEAASIE